MKEIIRNQYRLPGMWLLAMLTLCGNGVAYAQEITIDVTDQVDLVQETAAEWTFKMPNYSMTAEVEYVDAVATVTKKVGDATNTESFATIDEAIEAAADGDVVRLCADISITAEEGPCGTGRLPIDVGTGDNPLELDLNGHTLSFPDGGYLDVSSWGYLKITDSASGGKVTGTERFAVWVSYGGYLIVDGGCVETTNTTGDPREKSAVYNQGVMFTDGGTVSGKVYGIYNEGLVNLRKGRIEASEGVGIEGDGELAMLDLPVFDCLIKDISLASDKLIYFSGWVYGVPEKKIVVSLANEEQKYFTYGYNMRTADGGITDPSKVFSVMGYGDNRIGFYYNDLMRTEAGIADLTEVTFPAGNSTYCDLRGLALYEENNNLKFYTVTGVDNTSVKLTEIKSKRFSGHAPLIVSNTTGAPITVQMVVGSGLMENSFLIAFNDDLEEEMIYPGFEGTPEYLEEIYQEEGSQYDYYGFNGEDFVPLSNFGPVEAHRCWLRIGDFSYFDEGDEEENTEGGLPASARRLSVVWPESTVKGNTGANGSYDLTRTTDAQVHGTVAFSVGGTILASGSEKASAEQAVTITVTPATGYVVESITATPSMTTSQMKVRGSLLNNVALTSAGANTWTMEMPAANVEFAVTYAKTAVDPTNLLTLENLQLIGLTPDAIKTLINKIPANILFGLINGTVPLETLLTIIGATDEGKLIINAGYDLKMVMKNLKKGDVIQFLFELDPNLAALLMTNLNLLKDITPPAANSRVRAFNAERMILPGHIYEVRMDCDLKLDVMAEAGAVIIEGITIRTPGDANGDRDVNVADIVEMVNEMDPNAQPSESFNLQNADMNSDQKITKDDIDAVVKLILQITE